LLWTIWRFSLNLQVMNIEKQRAIWRSYYHRNREKLLAAARIREREERTNETEDQRQKRLAYHRAYNRAKAGPALEELVPKEESARSQFKMIMVALLARRAEEIAAYRREWKRKHYGYKPRKPKAVKVKVAKILLTPEEKRAKIKAYQQRPDVKLKKAQARKAYNARLKARAASDPEFAAQLRKARSEAGTKWMDGMKKSDPARYADMIAQYKERQRIYSRRRWQRAQYREQQYAWHRSRRRTCPEFKIAQYIRNRINQALRGKRKASSAFLLVGCSPDELRNHLESKFEPGMSWDNWGMGENDWQIDHVRPLASFPLSDPEQQKLAFHFSNLKPEWAKLNSSKNSEWEGRKWSHSDHACQPAPTVQTPVQ